MLTHCPECKSTLRAAESTCPFCGCVLAAPGANVQHRVQLSKEQAGGGTTISLEIDDDGNARVIQIKIPAGVVNGSRIRIKGLGGRTAQAWGDLHVVVNV